MNTEHLKICKYCNSVIRRLIGGLSDGRPEYGVCDKKKCRKKERREKRALNHD